MVKGWTLESIKGFIVCFPFSKNYKIVLEIVGGFQTAGSFISGQVPTSHGCVFPWGVEQMCFYGSLCGELCV